MLRRIPRILRLTVLVAAVVAVSATVYQSWSTSNLGVNGWTQTQYGPLGPADRDLLVKVRLAGLWEMPTGQQMLQQAISPEVKEAGRKISTEHQDLDQQVRAVAEQLGVPLPTSPNAQQLGWMQEISSKTGSDLDRTAVQRLREAHGIVLPIIAQVRSSTRNDMIRQFAETATQFVTRHHQYLEGTGLVDYAALPAPSQGLLSGGTAPQDLIVPIIVFVAAVLAAIALVAGLRNRKAKPTRVTVPTPRAPAAAAAVPVPALTAVAALPAGGGSYGGGYAGDGEYHQLVTDSGPHRTVNGSTYERVPVDSGGYRAVDDTAMHVPVGAYDRGPSDTGGYRVPADSGAYRVPSDTGAYRAQRPTTDTGSYRAAGTGSYRSTTASGSYRAVSDTGSYRAADGRRAPSDSGSYRAVSDSGSYRAASDSGAYRSVSDSGSHRATPRSKSRHSMKR